MNGIQSKDYRIGTYFSCFDDKIYIQNNKYNVLTPG